MANYFSGHKEHPYHFSVGAVLMNDKGEVCAHHVNSEEIADAGRKAGYWTDMGVTDFYILMRETPEPGESPETALHRGLMEEFGATAEIKDYIGSIVSHWNHRGTEVEKTTIYFLCMLKDQDLTKRKGDIESKTEVEWHTSDFLVPKMRVQSVRYNRTDIDESAILERLGGLTA